MNTIKNEHYEFIKDFQKYRRYQAKLVKLKAKPNNQKNIKPMMALLANIKALLEKMDHDAKLLSPVAVASVKGLKKEYVN